ncbi:MAG: tyrosine-type recombinase/integrase, partial [Myxococcota bacterium]
GERALDRVNRYLVEVCPEWVVDRHEEALFINQYVARPSADALSARVTRYVDAANLGTRGSCHLFRQTMATLMLEGGADVRCVQQMLREPQDHERVHPRLYRPAQKGA